MRLIDVDKLIDELCSDIEDESFGEVVKAEILEWLDAHPVVLQWHKLTFRPLTLEEKEFHPDWTEFVENLKKHIDDINAETLDYSRTQPSACHWTPVSRALPDKLEPVLITWINRDPAPYYQGIKDKPFTGAAYYNKGKWWWYSPVCEDLLSEYGESPPDTLDEGIEVIAWRPFPKPYNPMQKYRRIRTYE